jgi:hypothetical protein
MGSTEHTAFAGASQRKDSRRLQAAILAALALLGLVWLALSVQTAPAPARDAAPDGEQASRNAQGVIRTTPAPQAAQDADASSLAVAGLKLERSLGTSAQAKTGGRGPAAPDSGK